MSMPSKNIFVVNCNKELFENSFSRKRSSDIINHYEISQRLTNNDVFKIPPSKEIIEYQIIKKLHSFKRCKKTEFLFFYADSLSKKLLINLKSIFSQSEIPVNFHLLIENAEEFSEMHNEFNSIQILEPNDKR